MDGWLVSWEMQCLVKGTLRKNVYKTHCKWPGLILDKKQWGWGMDLRLGPQW